MNRERRSYPRYPVQFPLKVSLPSNDSGSDEQVYKAEASNLSCTSIQFSCDSELVTSLLKQELLPHVCELEFTLPWDKHSFKISAQVVTHRRVSQRQYVLVLLLKHEDEAQEEILNSVLNKQQSVGLD